MSELSSKQCVPCRGGVPPLKGPELVTLQDQLSAGWTVVDGHHLEKQYRFQDFRAAPHDQCGLIKIKSQNPISKTSQHFQLVYNHIENWW